MRVHGVGAARIGSHVNINLMPREPLFRRFFYVWLVLTLFALIALAGFAQQLFNKQRAVASQLDKHVEQLSREKKNMATALKKYEQREKSWQKNKPYVAYETVVEQLSQGVLYWGDILSEMEKVLPDGGALFRLEVTGTTVQGFAVVHSLEGAASFMEKMQGIPYVSGFALETVNTPTEFVPLYVEDEGAHIFRFRFEVEVAEAETSESGDADDEAPRDDADAVEEDAHGGGGRDDAHGGEAKDDVRD